MERRALSVIMALVWNIARFSKIRAIEIGIVYVFCGGQTSGKEEGVLGG